MILVVCGFSGSRLSVATPQSDHRPTKPWQWVTVSVELPVSDEGFPPGKGVEGVTSHCLICHSAGMVLLQPPLKSEEWRAEIMKMRSVYGATVQDDEVEGLVDYLANLAKGVQRPHGDPGNATGESGKDTSTVVP